MSNKTPQCHVIVTRPTKQADSFCCLMDENHYSFSRLPLISIEAIDSTLSINTLNNAALNWVIFTSANAVIHSHSFRQTIAASLIQTQYAAIGAQTANRCRQHYIPMTISPSHTYNSESLLSLLTTQLSPQQTILIIKGEGGRNKLQQSLLLKNMIVYEADVYKRTQLHHSNTLYQLVNQKLNQYHYIIITLTSVEISIHFLSLLANKIIQPKNPLILLLGSLRILTVLMKKPSAQQAIHSYIKETIIAENPSDTSMLQALIQWKKTI